MRGGQRALTVTRQEHCRTCQRPRRLHVAREPLRALPRHRRRRSRRAAHMVFSKPCAHCGGIGTPAADALSGLRRAAGRDAHRDADDQRARRPGRRRARSACRARDTPAATAARAAICTSPFACSRIRCSAARATTCTSSCRSRSTRRRSARKIDVPSLDGPARLRVPPGTQSGQRFRLRERGVPSPRDGRRGDLVVEVRLVLPKLLDERSKELLREFGRINGEDVRKTTSTGEVNSELTDRR